MMICPAIGVALALPVALARLPFGLWIAVAGCMIIGAVTPLVLLHRAWTSINDGCARTSPRRAVWLLIVPFFNVYWMFHVILGLRLTSTCSSSTTKSMLAHCLGT